MESGPKYLDTLLSPAVEGYLRGLYPQPHPVLAALEARAAEEDFPIVGPQVGALLALLVRISGVRTVFEMGSGFGYSAAWIAGALPSGGSIILTDGSESRLAAARSALDRLETGAQISTRRGDALELLEKSAHPYDMIFCDVDKEAYPDAFKIASGLLHPGGLFVCDNALWKGRVAAPVHGDSEARAVRTMNQMAFGHPDYDCTLVPFHDGVLVARRHGPAPVPPLRRGEQPRRRRDDR